MNFCQSDQVKAINNQAPLAVTKNSVGLVCLRDREEKKVSSQYFCVFKLLSNCDFWLFVFCLISKFNLNNQVKLVRTLPVCVFDCAIPNRRLSDQSAAFFARATTSHTSSERALELRLFCFFCYPIQTITRSPFSCFVCATCSAANSQR